MTANYVISPAEALKKIGIGHNAGFALLLSMTPLRDGRAALRVHATLQLAVVLSLSEVEAARASAKGVRFDAALG